MRTTKQLIGAITLFLFLWGDGIAQVKTFSEVNGFDFGERITESWLSVRYLEYLESASDRVGLIHLGHTWDRKPMVMAVVTSPENHARIDQIRANAHRLNDPRTTSSAQATQIIETQPVIVYLGGSIHGFELSGADAMLMLLEKLVTDNSDAMVEILQNTVILLDPIINPDGRDAFAQFNHQRTGRVPNPMRDDWNNDFSRWHGLQFRTSHYFFDMNRDWFAHTHPEVRNRVDLIREWRPQVGVDAHEMGSDVEFYFDPPTDPYAPYFPDFAKKWFTYFGQAYAEAFDEEGFEYMTREMFNYFYPGYTTSFLSYQGAVGMLFEQGSTRGLAITRADGSTRTYRDAVEQQFTAALATVRLSSEKRRELLQDYFTDHQKAITDGRTGFTRYFITPEGDPHLVAELVNALQRLGIEVSRLDESLRLRSARDRYGKSATNVTLPAGSYVIDASQPRNRYIRTLLEPSLEVPADFLELARQRIDRGENPRFYDMTAWSLPLLFNVKAYSSTGTDNIRSTRLLEPVNAASGFPERFPAYAYMVDGSQARAMSVLYHMKKLGYTAGLLTKPTKVDGQSFSSGTVIFRTRVNGDRLHYDLQKTAARFEVDVRGVNTGHAEPGHPSLGSNDMIPVREPKIALIAEEPIHPYSFGWAWFKLDRQYEIDQTILRAGSIAGTDLSRFNVIVVPEVLNARQFGEMLGEGGKNRLGQWIRDGGTIVAIGSATDFIRNELELGGLKSFYDKEENKNLARISVPGSLVRAEPDFENWLVSGYSGDIPFLIFSNRVYDKPDGPPSAARRTPLTVPSDNAFIAGHFWEESIERLPGSVVLYEERIGRGRVVLFAEDVNFRGYWRGADRLFLNAVLLGPSAN